MSRLREARLGFVGMSSVGPSIAVVTDRSETDMTRPLEPMGLKIATSTKVDNEGLKVERVGPL